MDFLRKDCQNRAMRKCRRLAGPRQNLRSAVVTVALLEEVLQVVQEAVEGTAPAEGVAMIWQNVQRHIKEVRTQSARKEAL